MPPCAPHAICPQAHHTLPPLSQVRTENPGEANLFYVPLLSHLYDSSAGVRDYTRNTFMYINNTFPHLWARNLGGCYIASKPGEGGAHTLDTHRPRDLGSGGAQTLASTHTATGTRIANFPKAVWPTN